MEPSFVLRGANEAVVADGIVATFPDVEAARAALATGVTPIVVGALPFDISQPAALLRPRTVCFTETLPSWPVHPLPAVRVSQSSPAPEEHRARIRIALSKLSDGDVDGTLRKVVLARALRLTAEQPLDVRTLLSRLAAADPAGYVYFTNLTSAGGAYQESGAALIGASPELLVARQGAQVRCRPFAGSAPRSPDLDIDSANGAGLALSSKNRREHRLVIDDLRTALQPLCVDLQIPAQPQLSKTAALWHLSTPISGMLRDPSMTALDLALALHPTPAVCGVPAGAAASLIAELEGDRGFYAGAVGWCDQYGDGCWVVSIRGAQLSADRCVLEARAGGGIVAGSDPDDELDETTTKFKTILAAVGLSG